MSEDRSELAEAVALALKLSPLEKVHLVERVVATLEKDLTSLVPKPRHSLLGVLSAYGTVPSAEDIDEARREMWGNFPREDI